MTTPSIDKSTSGASVASVDVVKPDAPCRERVKSVTSLLERFATAKSARPPAPVRLARRALSRVRARRGEQPLVEAGIAGLVEEQRRGVVGAVGGDDVVAPV